jgi:hypothetical protein
MRKTICLATFFAVGAGIAGVGAAAEPVHGTDIPSSQTVVPLTSGTCSNGVRDPDEEGVDCGGAFCVSCDLWPVQLMLSAQNPACLACADSKGPCHLLLLDQDCDRLTGNAAAGPAAGQPKATLCRTLLQKMLDTRCAAGPDGDATCYCGSVSSDTCFAVEGNGDAKSEEEAALETTDPPTIFQNFEDLSVAGGRANRLVQCLNDNNRTSCFQGAAPVPFLGGGASCLLGFGLALAGCLRLSRSR